MHIICLMKLLAAVAVSAMVGVTVVQCLPSSAPPTHQSLSPMVTNSSTADDHNQHNQRQQPNHGLVRRDANECNNRLTKVGQCISIKWSGKILSSALPTGGIGGLLGPGLLGGGGGNGGLLGGGLLGGGTGLRTGNGVTLNEPMCCMFDQLYCSSKKLSLDDVCAGISDMGDKIEEIKKQIENCHQKNFNPTEQLCKPQERLLMPTVPNCQSIFVTANHKHWTTKSRQLMVRIMVAIILTLTRPQPISLSTNQLMLVFLNHSLPHNLVPNQWLQSVAKVWL